MSPELYVHKIRAIVFSAANCSEDAQAFNVIRQHTDDLLSALSKQNRLRETEPKSKGRIEAFAVQVFCSMVSGKHVCEHDTLTVFARDSISAARILADELDNKWGR